MIEILTLSNKLIFVIILLLKCSYTDIISIFFLLFAFTKHIVSVLYSNPCVFQGVTVLVQRMGWEKDASCKDCSHFSWPLCVCLIMGRHYWPGPTHIIHIHKAHTLKYSRVWPFKHKASCRRMLAQIHRQRDQ